jgi:H+/Cl- antiporter ClcA
MNPFRTGKLVLFQVTYNRDWHFFEIMFFVILGIFGVQLQVPFYSEAHRSLRDYMVPL